MTRVSMKVLEASHIENISKLKESSELAKGNFEHQSDSMF